MLQHYLRGSIKSRNRLASITGFALLTGMLTFISPIKPVQATMPSLNLLTDLRANKSSSYSSGSTWYDLSGNSRNATLGGSPTWSSTRGGVFTLDGTDHFTLPSGFADFTTGLSVSIVANFGSNSSTRIWERLLDFGNGNANENFLFARFGDSGDLTFEVYQGSNSRGHCKFDGGILENTWATYGVTLDGTTCKIYRDGVERLSTPYQYLPLNVTRANNYIGRSNWSADAYFDTGISAFAIWNRALSPSEMSTVANIQNDVTSPTTSIGISAAYITSGTSVSNVLNTNETLSSVSLYYSTSASLTSPQSCGSTSNPINGQTLTCSVPASDATYYFYSIGTDSAGNVEGSPLTADDSIIRDTAYPTYMSSTIASSGTSISLTYNETLSVTTAAAARFTVTRGGSETVTVNSVSISDSSLTLNLASTIYLGQSITVSYSDPTVGSDDANAIQDLAGNDAASLTNQSVTNNSTITIPGAPTIGTPTAGNGQVTVTWTAPGSNGGASITDYVVQYSSDAGSTWTTFSDGVSTSTSATVTGLTAGIAYKFRVSAVNGAGTGTVSDSSVVRIPQLSGATACGNTPGTGNPYQIHGGGSPSNEICSKAFDNDTSTKYLNWGGASQTNGANDVGSIGGLNTSVLIDLKSSWAVTRVGLTTANDFSNRDPVKFELYGSNTSLSAGWNLVDSSGALSPPTGRYTDYSDETIDSPGSYRYYKLKFTQTRSTTSFLGADPIVAVSEIRLYGNQVSALSVTYNTQGGSAIDTGSTLANGSIGASPGSPTRTGYTFGGWSASQNGSAISFPYTHGQSSNFSLYALWTSTLSITTPVSGLSGRYGTSYSLTVSTTGGSGGNSFAIASGVLPTGLTLNSSTGVIAGTPTQIVSAPITISVTDSSTASVTSSTFSIVISRGTQSITLSSLGTSSKTYPYSQALSMSTSGKSGTGDVTYSIASGGTATGCALSDSTSATATLSASTSGTCLIAATVATDATYESATSTSLTFTFSKASQSTLTITTTTIAYGEVLALAASGGSGGGSLSFARVDGTCSVSGSNLTPTATGSCTITATKASDSNYLAETSSVTTITITAGSASASIAFASTTFTFGITNTITITTSTEGTVSFKANGKIIKYCKSKATVTAGSITATCAYRPSTRRPVAITATLTPTDTNISPKVSTSSLFQVVRRTGARG